jgi:hypothetical protein
LLSEPSEYKRRSNVKDKPTDTLPTSSESSTAVDASTPAAADTQSLWLLKDGTAPKLGARAEGSINYNVLADNDRHHLFIAITGNKGGATFAKSVWTSLRSKPAWTRPHPPSLFHRRPSSKRSLVAVAITPDFWL